MSRSPAYLPSLLLQCLTVSMNNKYKAVCKPYFNESYKYLKIKSLEIKQHRSLLEIET